MRQSITDEYGEQLLLRASPALTLSFRWNTNRPMELASRPVKNGLVPLASVGRTGASARKNGVAVFRNGKIFAADAYLFLWNLHHDGRRLCCRGVGRAQVPTPISRSAVRASRLRRLPSPSPTAWHSDWNRAGSATPARFSAPRCASFWISASERSYSAACSSGATRGRMIWIRVPPPGSESRSSRPPRRLVTML